MRHKSQRKINYTDLVKLMIFGKLSQLDSIQSNLLRNIAMMYTIQ